MSIFKSGGIYRKMSMLSARADQHKAGPPKIHYPELGSPSAGYRVSQNSNGEPTSTLGSTAYVHRLLMWPIPTNPSNFQEAEIQKPSGHSDGSREARKPGENTTADISVRVSTLIQWIGEEDCSINS
jgi:hypothetical protein